MGYATRAGFQTSMSTDAERVNFGIRARARGPCYVLKLALGVVSTASIVWLGVPAGCIVDEAAADELMGKETQITTQPTGRILTNINVWSPDGKWIVYDTRSDAAGEKFDGSTIEIVNVETGEVREVYRSRNGAHCGVATFSPAEHRVVFIAGPENPTADWQYGPTHRQGVVVDIESSESAMILDARDIMPPFTPGALRGGSHVHVFDSNGKWVSFTYEDHVLAALDGTAGAPPHDANQRNVGISVSGQAVQVSPDHPRNHDGSTFTVLVTRTVNNPQPGSDEISRAFEEGWIGDAGYVRADGSRQRHALAFQGNVVTADGKTISEVFVADIPETIDANDQALLAGTERTRPAPPSKVEQRRLTYTAGRRFPGIQGPRHWLRSSPDGTRIAFLMRDDAGTVQIWSISPHGGEPQQVTRDAFDIASAFSWSPDGRSIAYIADNSVFLCDVESGESQRLTPHSDDKRAPRPEACVYSPDGRRIAYVRRVPKGNSEFNQVFVVDVPTTVATKRAN